MPLKKKNGKQLNTQNIHNIFNAIVKGHYVWGEIAFQKAVQFCNYSPSI